MIASLADYAAPVLPCRILRKPPALSLVICLSHQYLPQALNIRVHFICLNYLIKLLSLGIYSKLSYACAC
jgi:hypothetical protein